MPATQTGPLLSTPFTKDKKSWKLRMTGSGEWVDAGQGDCAGLYRPDPPRKQGGMTQGEGERNGGQQQA